ncbi:Sensory transduction protein regX3 [Micromonospora sp. MW-13]|uniref:response regulator transcription factor n=1 Tax=Micromonospora sp. MW-13 TaxID=2094022 RepID=UPI000E44C36D|nr:response regulator transcription factor [Micromonospora sp. MW-13]RGC69348.1 Sensory transduction protein regX3 [Micromonospora sp. MW-13]
MHVLAVEHDGFAAERLVGCVRRLGYRVTSVPTGREALSSFDGSDLVLLDLDLPDIDGLDVCRNIRAAGDTPVIAFTSGGGEADRVLGLQAGADDCMGKPYGLRELSARMEALLRRASPARDTGALQRGALRIDPAIRQVSVGRCLVPLTRKEFDLLYLLASDPDRVFTREELMARVWQDGGAVARSSRASRTLDTHVGTLRQKIGSGGWIVTVRGVGFRLGLGESHALVS